MKKITIKLMGVVLTLALLAGLVMAAVPVSAGNMNWSNLNMPELTAGTTANVYAVSDDGSVIYLYDNNKIQKSTDGGYTWDDELETPKAFSDDATPTPTEDNAVITGIAIFPDNTDRVLVTDGDYIWSTKNGGDSWKVFADPDDLDDSTVNGIDIGGEDDIIVAVATDSGVYLYDDVEGDWYTPADTAWDTDDITAGAALAVGVSPNYADDAVVVAVADMDEEIELRAILVDFDKPETMKWDIDIDRIPGDASGSNWSIAFPSDFDSASEYTVFVGADDVYRVTDDDEEWIKLGAGLGVYSIAYKGTVDDGTLAAGGANGTVKTSTQAGTDDDPDWIKSDKDPYGANAVVAFAGDDTLFVGTDRAFFAADADTEYGSFDGIAFISVDDLTTVSFQKGLKGAGTDNLLRVIKAPEGAATRSMIFASTDAGKTWKMIYSATDVNIDDIYITRNYAEDQTIYIFQGPTAYRYVKSTDGGASWSKPTNLVDKTNGTAFALIDADTYWTGSKDGIIRSDWSDPVDLDDETPELIIDFGAFQVVTTKEGSVWASTDGTTFDVLGEGEEFSYHADAPGPFPATFDVPNKTVYAADADGVQKWIIGESDDWITEINFADLPDDFEFGTYPISSLSLASDGVYYITSMGNENGQVWRSASLKAENFEAVRGSDFDADTIAGDPPQHINWIAPGPQSVYKDANGNSVLVQTVNGTNDENNYPVAMYVFTQTVGDAPVTVAPAANALVASNLDFSWEKVSYTGTVRYELQIAYDADFNNIVGDNDYKIAEDGTAGTSISGTMKSIAGLPTGKTLYWRVRVAPNYPIASKWSPAIQFQTKVVSANLEDGITARLAPVSGATGVSVMPAMTWGAVAGASGYNFELASDSGFTQIVESKTGLTSTAVTPSKPLNAGTVYFWRVQAVDGANVGDWVVSAFTTAAASSDPGDPGTPISQPTIPPITIVPGESAPAPTPAYIWVIIAIGAVLVIAVIVLIARTRRV